MGRELSVVRLREFFRLGNLPFWFDRLESARSRRPVVTTECLTMETLSLTALAAEFRSMVEHLDAEPYYKAFHTLPSMMGRLMLK